MRTGGCFTAPQPLQLSASRIRGPRGCGDSDSAASRSDRPLASSRAQGGSAGLSETMETPRRDGRFRPPWAPSVHVTRLNDYYWWENHRPLPTWYAFWEVNTSLIRPTTEPAR